VKKYFKTTTPPKGQAYIEYYTTKNSQFHILLWVCFTQITHSYWTPIPLSQVIGIHRDTTWNQIKHSLYWVKLSLHELTIDPQGISKMFSSISYEHQKGLILVHSATKIFANLHIFLVKDNARDESDHTYII